MTEKIGWVGIGAMGQPIVANVAKAGFDLTVCTRRPEAVTSIQAMGANITDNVAATASQCDIIFVCLPSTAASEAVANQVFGAKQRPEIYVELSTLSPVFVRDLAVKAAAAGMTLIDAPVSGNAKARSDGALTAMVGADEATYARIRPVLEAFARRIFLMGPVGSGSMAKVCNQLLVMTSLVSSIESLLLGVRQGLEVTALTDGIMAASGAAWTVPVIASEYTTRTYRSLDEPRAALRLAVKDLELAVGLAAEVGLPTRVAAAALSVWREAETAGLGDADIYTLIDHIEGKLPH
jgi:3-hydroxyisobutyrate dehydrogenase-like beta-hydroxyacid dehydrogenase